MNPYMGLFSAWGLITLALVALLLYRFRIVSQESDWIHMTNDAAEDRAIQQQIVLEARKRKLVIPIWALSLLSLFLLLGTGGFWLYQAIMTPPAP